MSFSVFAPRRRPVTKTARIPQAEISAGSSRLQGPRDGPEVNHVHVLNRLLDLLKQNDVPGPQLFRLQTEFSLPLGEGGQGNVRGIDRDCAKQYSKIDKKLT